MKKMIAYILIAAACGFAGFATAALLSESKHADEKAALQIELDKEKHNSLLLERRVDELIDSKDELENKIEVLTIEADKLERDYELLETVIQRMKEAPQSKLLKERLPNGMTNTMRFMDYTTITDTNSLQYKLQEVCETNFDTGIRAYYVNETKTDYLCVALGSAYGCEIGDTWKVTLKCGTEFNVILAENKDDGSKGESFGDPDENYDGELCTNVIEFVTDEPYMPSSVISKGTYTVLDEFGGIYGDGGNILKMEYTGRIWQ